MSSLALPEGDSTKEVVEDTVIRNRQYITYSDGSQWSRKVAATIQEPVSAWTRVEAAVRQPDTEPLQFHVVTYHQVEGEPKHWSLFAGRAENGKTTGQEWQVTGDAECMHYEHKEHVDPFTTEDFAWQQLVNKDLTDDQLAKIVEAVNAELPPHAKDRKSVVENCQGWTIRVLWRLVAEGVADPNDIVKLETAMDPLK